MPDTNLVSLVSQSLLLSAQTYTIYSPNMGKRTNFPFPTVTQQFSQYLHWQAGLPVLAQVRIALLVILAFLLFLFKMILEQVTVNVTTKGVNGSGVQGLI